MAQESQVIKELLENGAHFGHQKNKWNPKMKQYIFGEKNGIYILDLEKTEESLKVAMDFLFKIAKEGKKVLFVGTKKQAKQVIRDEATKAEMYYIDERWLGGCLTNFETIRRSIKRLAHLENMKTDKIYEALAKKEKVKLEREEYKLLKNLRGIRDMAALPGALVVVDTEIEKIAVQEAIRMEIPIVALLDTNCDPDKVDYPIPANDDAIRTIKYVVARLADSIIKGRAEFDSKGPALKKVEVAPEQEAPKPKAKKEEQKEAPKAVKEEKKASSKQSPIEGDISI